MKIMLFLLLAFVSNAFANSYLETSTFRSVEKHVRELSEKYGPSEVLLVFDIDNTLLRAKQDLGSDQWFEWQSDAISHNTSEAGFKDFDTLLEVQAHYYQLSTMSLTEACLPGIMKSFKDAGHPMFLLTSRGPNLRNVTERELKRNQLWFADSALMKGIAEDITEAPFKNSVSFMNGIFMTSGHHKGEALDYLVKKSGKSFKAIIFVDDLERHTKRVFDKFASTNTEISTFRFSREDVRVKSFKEGSKEEVTRAAAEIEEVMKKAFAK